MEYVRYANQDATRSQPLNERLLSAMSFLPELGLTMEVHSGGQDAEGPNRVGSTRHDHGGAGDVDFITADGRRLSASNPQDQAILSQVVARAKANGVTGFGQGSDYMGDTRIHLGFGAPGVWGADGKSANAPDWLKAAYSGAPSAPAQSVGNDTMAALGMPRDTPQQPFYGGAAANNGYQAAMMQPPVSMQPQQQQNALARMQQPRYQNALAQYSDPAAKNALGTPQFQTNGLGRALLSGVNKPVKI